MLLTLLLLPTSLAAVLTVGPDGMYSTISNAISAGTDGDTIEVGSGSYAERVDFAGKALTIQATDGPEVTFITGDGSVSVAAWSGESADSQLIGFTVRGEGHTCIQTDGTSPRFSNLVIESCGASTLPYGGGAILFGGSPHFDNVVFSNNTAIHGGALRITSSAEASFTECSFQDNVAEIGGAIHLANSNAVFEESDLIDNRSTVGDGGAIWSSTASLTMTGGRFEDNTAAMGGGAIFTSDSTLQLMSVDALSGNEASYSEGGAILIDGADDILIQESSFQNNEAWLMGGAISAHSVSNLVIEDTVLDDNTSSEEAAGGGAIAIYETIAHLTNTNFFGNQANGDGGALQANSSVVEVESSIFNLNVTRARGGAWHHHDGIVSFSGSEFERNDGADGGGGLSIIDADATITDVGFLWNESSGGHGGGLLYDGPNLEIDRAQFQRNSGQIGGGLHTTGTEELAVIFSVFQENEALFSSGGAYISAPLSTSATLTNNDFVANETLSSSTVAQLALSGMATFDVRNNIIVNGRVGFGVGVSTESADDRVWAYNNVWANDGGEYTRMDDPSGSAGNITADPMFQELSEDRDFDNDDLSLVSDSPCLEAGDPETPTADGSRANIGAYGLTEASADDADGDGYDYGPESDEDCDDSDPEVNPGALEVCDDAIDNNCDGFIDEGCAEDTGDDTGLFDTGDPGDTDTPADTGGGPDTGEPTDNPDDREGDESDWRALGDNKSPYEIDGDGCHCSNAASRTPVMWFLLLPLIILRRGTR